MKQQLVIFIINGSKRLSKQTQATISACRSAANLSVECYTTTHKGHASALGREHAQRANVLVAVGGDGTVNEVINGWMGNQQPKSVIGILPNGTGNDFYRSAQLNYSPDGFVKAIVYEQFESVDLVKISGINSIRYFANIADVGFGGMVVNVLEKQRKVFNGKISYAVAILRTFLTYRAPKLHLKWDDGEFEGFTFMVAICNGEMFADGLFIHPEASIHDGRINITLLKKIGILDYIKNIKNLRSGKRINHPEASYFDCSKIEISVSEGVAGIECDGEAFPKGDLVIEVLPKAMHLLGYTSNGHST